ncbi:MAG: condensation domain-containing protein, partial [Archangium sp.]
RAALGQALNHLVERHAPLRTRLVQRGEHYLQEVLAPRPLPVLMTDLSELPEKEKRTRAEALCQGEARAPFVLSEAPLLRVHLLKLAEEQWQLLLVIHHSISDGWSLGVMMRELSVLYAAALSGEPSPLAPLPTQFTDFARWQRAWLDAGRTERMLQFWKAELEGVPLTLNLPYDRPRPAQVSFRGAQHVFHIPRDRAAALEGVARRYCTTLYSVLLSTFLLQLSRLCQQEDFLVSIPLAGRVRREHEALLGLFVNNVPIRARLEGVPTFGKWVERVSRALFAAFDHEALPFSKVVEMLVKAHLEANPGAPKPPFPQVLFQLLNTPSAQPTLPGLTVTAEDLPTGTSKADFLLVVIPSAGGGLDAVLEYRTELFDSSTMVRWAEHYVHLLGLVGQDPERPLGEYRESDS